MSLARKVFPHIEKSRYASALDATTVLAALEGMARPPSLDGAREYDSDAQEAHIAVLAEAIPPETEIVKITEIVTAAFRALGENDQTDDSGDARDSEKASESDASRGVNAGESTALPSTDTDEYTAELRERVRSLEAEVYDLRTSLKNWRARETLAREEVSGLRRALEVSGVEEAAMAATERKQQDDTAGDSLAAAVDSMRNLQSRLITELANSQSREEQARIEGKREAFATLEAYFSQLEKSSSKGKVKEVKGEETGHEDQGDPLPQSELYRLHC